MSDSDCSEQHAQTEPPAQTELALCSQRDGQKPDDGQEPDGMIAPLRKGVIMIGSFAKRGSRVYQALAQIAACLPDDGEYTKEAMDIVTEQRIWMMNTLGDVGAFVGAFHSMERNLLNEMTNFFDIGSETTDLKIHKMNARAMMENLELVQTAVDDTLNLVTKCEQSAEQVTKFEGTEMKLQEACLHKIAHFGGSKAALAKINDMDAALEKLKAAQDKQLKIVEDLTETKAKIPELSARLAVLDAITNDERRSMDQMKKHAEALEEEAKKKALEAGHAENTKIERKVGGKTVYTYEDNHGDAEKARAATLRQKAKESKGDATDQQERTKGAAAESAKVQGELEKATLDAKTLEDQARDAMQELVEARQQYQKLAKEAEADRAKYGGISLQDISELRRHLQDFPEMLGAKGSEDRAMFKTMKGHVDGLKAVMKRLKVFLGSQEDEKDLAASFKAVCLIIRNFKDQVQYYVGECEGLKQKVQDEIDKAKSLENGTAALQVNNATGSTPPPENATPSEVPQKSATQASVKITVSVNPDEDDDLW